VNLADPTDLAFAYEQWLAAGTADMTLANPALDVVHVGGGGFSFPRYLAAADPGSRHTVLELDPAVLATAEQELGFTPSDQIGVRLGDARGSLRALPSDSADLVVGDAFGGRSVPWHLATSEFIADVDRVLRPDGRYVMNIIDGGDLRFVRAEAATLRTRFEHVALVTFGATLDSRVEASNLVLVASHAPLDTAEIMVRVAAGTPNAAMLSTPAQLDSFTAGAPVLTDDFAPADQLLGQ